KSIHAVIIVKLPDKIRVCIRLCNRGPLLEFLPDVSPSTEEGIFSGEYFKVSFPVVDPSCTCLNENTTMNFEIPGYKERGLIRKFVIVNTQGFVTAFVTFSMENQVHNCPC
ncbi:hypothetical protein L9F63_019652, partial [Diploptera punctata]